MNTAADIRNFSIVGHASSGKTMLSEAMLACSGAINRMGKIAHGTTVSDYHTSEHQRQISVHASLLRTEWMGKKFNILDTPGYQDFITEALIATRVSDFALIVINAQHGVGVGTQRVWNYATELNIPKILVMNEFDKQNTHFDEILDDIRKSYGAGVFPMGVPINPGPGFNQVLDVLRNEICTYEGERGQYKEVPATGEWEAKVKQLHTGLIEHIAESNDTLLSKYFDQGGLSEEEFRAGIHEAVQKQHFIPLFCTSAETNVGVARLMDFIAKYGSSPVDRKRYAALDANGQPTEVRLTDPETAAFVFKTMAEAHFGELSFFRVYSGTVKSGSELYNTERNITERIGQVYVLNGHERKPT
ncbi:MAG: small GTP-binding protein, partial [Verrucomicrobiales bacterium]|nr:small GTP-binding protein [Verrucomicrobiales bacterium]